MDFGANKTPIEVIKEGAFRGTYFRDIYSSITGKWYKCHGKNLKNIGLKYWWRILVKNIGQKYYSDYYDVSVNKYGVKCGTSLRFWENKGWIDPYGWFQWYFRYWFGRRAQDDKRQINRWEKIISRFRGKLVTMIKDAGSKFDD